MITVLFLLSCFLTLSTCFLTCSHFTNIFSRSLLFVLPSLVRRSGLVALGYRAVYDAWQDLLLAVSALALVFWVVLL